MFWSVTIGSGWSYGYYFLPTFFRALICHASGVVQKEI